jgi:hypothetical protein
VNATATGGSAVNIRLADGTGDHQHTVTVKWKAGNTQNVNILVATGSGDTIDLSGSPVVLNASKTIWTGVAG